MSREAWRVTLSCWSGRAQISVPDRLWHATFPSSEDYSPHCVSHTLCLPCSLFPSLYLLCPYCTLSFLFSTIVLPLHTPLSISLSPRLPHPSSSLSISPSSTLSLFIPRNAVCVRLWLSGCWYSLLWSGVSDFHWCFVWTSVCFWHGLFTPYVLLHVLCKWVLRSALSSSSQHRERVCWCVGRQKKKMYVSKGWAAVWCAILFTANWAELCIVLL